MGNPEARLRANARGTHIVLPTMLRAAQDCFEKKKKAEAFPYLVALRWQALPEGTMPHVDDVEYSSQEYSKFPSQLSNRVPADGSSLAMDDVSQDIDNRILDSGIVCGVCGIVSQPVSDEAGHRAIIHSRPGCE